MHLERTMMIAAALALIVASVAANPIPIPSLLMPEEFIDADIDGPPEALRAVVDGRYPFTNLAHQSVKMLYPVAPDSANIGVWIDGNPLNWWWTTKTYPTILPEWPQLPMTEWNIDPVPDQFTISAHYEHGVIRRPGEFVFLYPMGTGKYLQTYAKQTTAQVTVDLDGRYLPKGVFRDADPAPFRLAASGDDWRLSAEITSAMFQPLLQDFILTFIDRWADPWSWFSQPPDMADGGDICSSVEVNCLPPADDFLAPAGGAVPATVKLIRWWTDDPAHAVEFFTFGYDHPWASEDVSWELTTRREGPPPESYTFRESWDAPVGSGAGPVHGPASEPRVDMAFVLSSAGESHPMRYRLIEGSTLTLDRPPQVGQGLTEDCDNCERPAVTVPIRGSFWLHPTEVDPLFLNFAVRCLRSHSLGPDPVCKGEGHGTYRLGGGVALMQQMILEGQINELKDLHFDSGLVPPQAPFPWIEIDVPQVSPTDPLHIFTLHLVAVPWPAVWFSTEAGLTPSAGGHVSDGDLLSSIGRVVRTNEQLNARLGIMPIVPDIGLDAVGIAWPVPWLTSAWMPCISFGRSSSPISTATSTRTT